MRAGRFDTVVETGALWSRDFQVVKPGSRVDASTVVAGDRVFVDGWPWEVYSAAPYGNGYTRLVFGQGLYNDPVLTVPDRSLVQLGVLVVIVEAAAAWWKETMDPLVNPPGMQTPIPTTISLDGFTLSATLDADTTLAMARWEGAHSWDVYAKTAEWDWQRITEGTFTIVKGDAR